MSNRLFEEISRRNKDNEPERLRFREQEDRTKAYGSSEVTTINMLLSKEEYKANLEKSGLHRENRNKSTGHSLKDGISQAEPDVKMSINLTEVKNKFPVKSDVREKLLRNIINTYGRKIENNQLGQGLNTLKQVLQSPAPDLIEKSKRAEKIRAFYKRAEDMNLSESERNSYSIEEENSPTRYFKNFLSEKMSGQFSRHIEGVSVSKKYLEEISGKMTDSNLISSNLTKSSLTESSQRSKANFADYHMQAFKSLKPEEQLVESNEFEVHPKRVSEQFSRHIEGVSVSKKYLEEISGKMTDSNLISSNLTKSSLTESSQRSKANFADYHMQAFKSLKPEEQLVESNEFEVHPKRVSEQFSKRIEGISASKKSLEEKLRGNSGQNSYISDGNTSYNAKGLKSESNQLSERIRNPFDINKFDRNQFDKISVSDLKILENNRKPDLLSLTSVNLLIEEAYSNSIKKSDINEENRELLLNLIGNLSQVINQTNRDTTPTKQNILNIQVSGESPTGENDLKNLSDRLVLILKNQARRHGIDLS